MTRSGEPRHVEVKEGDRTVAAAEVTVSGQAGGTVRTSLHAEYGHIAPGRRASLVDAVMDLPEVQASGHLEATVPSGDTEFLMRLLERTRDAVTYRAGSTVLLNADIPPPRARQKLAPAGCRRSKGRRGRQGWTVPTARLVDRRVEPA